jgi:polyphosphate kinase 2 (PPK2 family)
VLVLEGKDAGGKGGVIRRLTQAMDVQDYRIVPIGAPSDEELRHHYLWRFWRQLPRAGRMVIFDRSWYGRVLVERVEGLASESALRRAYAEINDFEEQLVEEGVLLLKFWLQIDDDEQARRFEARESTPYKKYKITEEDYRNRARWPDYECAVNEMMARTSTELAPWRLVPANDKRFARVEVLRAVCDGLGRLTGEEREKT